jgi:hypothetical protein
LKVTATPDIALILASCNHPQGNAETEGFKPTIKEELFWLEVFAGRSFPPTAGASSFPRASGTNLFSRW